MKKLYCLKIFLLLYFSYFSSKLYSKEEITVLLEAHSTKNRNESCILFNFKNIQKISNVEEKNQFATFSFPQDVTLEYSLFDHHWYLNKKKLKINNLILSASQEPYIEYKETKYDNAVKIIIQDDIIHLIHTTDLEDYVLSVVVHEIYPEWPDSALEAAAIAARTYAIYKKIEAEKRNKLFHIKSSQEHQRYNGLSENERVKKAVDKTKKKLLHIIIILFLLCITYAVVAFSLHTALGMILFGIHISKEKNNVLDVNLIKNTFGIVISQRKIFVKILKKYY